MNAIVGFSSLLQDATDDERQQYVEIINRGSEQLLSLINDILEMSSIEAGTLDLCEEPFDISEDFNAMAEAMEGLKKGDIVKATVTSIEDKGVNVDVNGVAAMIKKADLSKDKAAQNPENYKEGDVLEAKVTSVDKKNNKIGLSIKALEIEEEKKALEEYSSTSSSNSALGDALGEALKKNA